MGLGAMFPGAAWRRRRRRYSGADGLGERWGRIVQGKERGPSGNPEVMTLGCRP